MPEPIGIFDTNSRYNLRFCNGISCPSLSYETTIIMKLSKVDRSIDARQDQNNIWYVTSMSSNEWAYLIF